MKTLNGLRAGVRAFATALCAAALVSACSILPQREIVQTWQPP
jgi:hypothetical protein